MKTKIPEQNKQLKVTTTEPKNSDKSSVWIFSIENTNEEFESYIDSLMDKEVFYGEPIY